MDTYVKLNSQTVGKDRLARLLQYSSKALWYYMKVRQMSPKAVDKLQSLEFNLSNFRKLLRIGKSLELLHQAFKTINLTDKTVQVSLTLSKIATALFLFFDHILWIGRSGLASVNTDKWALFSNKYWLFSIVMNLVRDMYELENIFKRDGILSDLALAGRSKAKDIIYAFCQRNQAVLLDALKNGCDVWIPLTALGYTKLKPGTIGLLGTISSIVGIVTILSPLAKLTPS